MPEFEWNNKSRKKKKKTGLKRTKYERTNKEVFENKPVCVQDKSKITLQEIHFCHEYLNDLDVANAAVRANLIGTGGTAAERYDKAMAVFNQPRVQRYLAQIFEHRIEATKVTNDKIVNELARIAFNDPAEYFDEFGDLKQIHNMSPAARAAIREIETKKVVEGKGKDRQVAQVTKVKLYDKPSALVTLMKHIGMIAPDKSTTYNIQYNNNSKTTNVAVNNTVRLDEFSDKELDLLEKMLGDSKLQDIVELEKIEQGALDVEYEETEK